MAPQFPSIQSFFQPEMPRSPTPATNSAEVKAGDGFTLEEVEATLKPNLHKWQPRCDYNKVDIGSLEPGPGCVMLVGRVVNIYHEEKSSKTPNGAKGCLRLIVKDDTGAVSVPRAHPSTARNTKQASRLDSGTPKSTMQSA